MEEEEGEVVAVVPPEDLPDAHQVVHRAAPDPEVLLHAAVRVVQVRQVVLGLEVLLHLVVGPPVRRQLARSLGSLDQMGFLLNPIILVRVRVPVF